MPTDPPLPARVPAEGPTHEHVAIAKARQAVTALRDFAREHGLHFRQRDPLVLEIHNALDIAAALSRCSACGLTHDAETCPRCWHPIETAPRDGTPFRAYGPELVHPDFNPWGQVEAVYEDDRLFGAIWDGQFDCWNSVEIGDKATHWQPFPPSPKEPRP